MTPKEDFLKKETQLLKEIVFLSEKIESLKQRQTLLRKELIQLGHKHHRDEYLLLK